MRIQFLVIAHEQPELLWRLSSRLLQSEDTAVSVQWDCSAPPPPSVRGLPAELRITQNAVGWGTGSQLLAVLDSLHSLVGRPFDTAMSVATDAQATLTDTVKELERAQHRLDLANRGIFLQEDGKEPEWSWRSIDEIRLEAARTIRAALPTACICRLIPPLTIARSLSIRSSANPPIDRCTWPSMMCQYSWRGAIPSAALPPAGSDTTRSSLRGQRGPRSGNGPVLLAPGTTKPGTVGSGGPTSQVRRCPGRF